MLTLSQTSSCQVSMANDGQRFVTEFEERKNGRGDVEIVVNEMTTKAHRVVLTDCSDYFKTMFMGGFSESNTGSIDLSHVFDSVDELNNFLDFMYTGNICLSDENILFVLNAASLFLLPELQAACAEFLIVNVAPSTCMSIFIVAERYSLKELQEVCVEVISAWFPLALDDPQEAVEMPLDCLKILIDKNVIDLLSEERRDTFLQKWDEHFRNSTNGNVPLPKEIQDLLKLNTKSYGSEEGAQAGGSKGDEDEMEEVLLTLLVAPPPGSDQCCVEIQAFAPKLKTWKVLLRHKFSKRVKPKIIPTLIGVSEGKAFFLFEKAQLNDEKGCVISVHLQSNEENSIKLPDYVYTNDMEGTPHFLVWGESLCGFFVEKECYRWALFKNNHTGKCSEICDGKCWEEVYYMPVFKRFDPVMDCVDYVEIGSYEFLTKAFGKDLYVWIKNDSTMRCYLSDMRYYRISPSQSQQGQYEMTELPPPWDHEEIDFFDFENYDSDASYDYGSDSDLEDPKWTCSTLSSIALDSRSSTMKFIMKIDRQDEVTDLEYLHHREYVHTFDILKNEWKDKGFCKVVYPEDCPGPMKYDDEDNFSYEDYPFRNPYTKTDGEDDYYNEIIGRLYTHELVMYEYYMRHTSPYNTSVWKLEPEGQESKIITHLPHSIYKFQGYLPSEIRSGFFKSLPKAAFQDFSEKIGHSAVAYVYPPSADFQLVFNGRLLAHKEYEDMWARLWQESIKGETRQANIYTLEQTSTCIIGKEPEKKYADELNERKRGNGDLTIVVNNDSTKVHRAVVMEKSDYFKTMFSSGFSESNAASINLSDVFDNIDEADTIFDYMYTGCMTLSEQNIVCVVNVACLFLVSELQDACTEFLTSNIAPCTCIAIFILADRYSLKDVRSACVEVLKAWFPYMLWSTAEALEIPPDTLQLFINEGIMDFMPDDIKRRFLKKWCQNRKSGCSGDSVSIPAEVTGLLKVLESDQDAGKAKGACNKPDGEEMEDVLLAVMTSGISEPQQCCIEVHAFSPERRKWKCVLRHVFSKVVKPGTEPKLLGVRNAKAVFVFSCSDLVNSDDCVIVVDIQSKKEVVIKLPDKVRTDGFNSVPDDAHYFFWKNDLCAIFQKGKLWHMFRNCHAMGSSEDCNGKCWQEILKFTYQFMNNALDQRRRTSSFLTKAVGNDLYLWTKEAIYDEPESWEPTVKYHVVRIAHPKIGNSDGKDVCGTISSGDWNEGEKSKPKGAGNQNKQEKLDPKSSVDGNERQKSEANSPSDRNEQKKSRSESAGDQNQQEESEPKCVGDQNEYGRLSDQNNDGLVDFDFLSLLRNHGRVWGQIKPEADVNMEQASSINRSEYSSEYDPLKPMIVNKKSVCEVTQFADEPSPRRKWRKDYSLFTQIRIDPMAENLTFIHLLEDNELRWETHSDGANSSWKMEHTYQFLNLNIRTNTWKQSRRYKVYSPDAEIGIDTLRPTWSESPEPVVIPCRKLVKRKCEKRSTGPPDLLDHSVSRDSASSEEEGTFNMSFLDSDEENEGCLLVYGPETQIGAQYIAKTTSPYCTHIWELEPVARKWQMLTILPLSLYKFPYFQIGEMSHELLKTLPNSGFEDFSEKIGQSAVACFHTLESMCGMSYPKKVLGQKSYDETWAGIWAGTFKSG